MVKLGTFEKFGRKTGRLFGQESGKIIGGKIGEESGKRVAESIAIASQQPHLLHHTRQVGAFVGQKTGEKIGGELGKRSFQYGVGSIGRVIDRVTYAPLYTGRSQCGFCGHWQDKRVQHSTKCSNCRRGWV